MKYKVRKGTHAEREYQDEYRWSVKQWGRAHAGTFFDKADEIISSLSLKPFSYPRPTDAKGDYRVINLKGIRIAYHVDEGKKVVTVLAIVGRNRYHEIEEKALQALKRLKE